MPPFPAPLTSYIGLASSSSLLLGRCLGTSAAATAASISSPSAGTHGQPLPPQDKAQPASSPSTQPSHQHTSPAPPSLPALTTSLQPTPPWRHRQRHAGFTPPGALQLSGFLLVPFSQQQQQQQQQQPAPRAFPSAAPMGPVGRGVGCSDPRAFSGWTRAMGLDSDRQMTNAIIAACCVTYLLQMSDPSITHAYAQINVLISARGEYYRLLTAAFLHASPLHLLSNMLSLHWTGPRLEQLLGRSTFTLVFLTSVLGGSGLNYVMGASHAASLGASGGICGLLAAVIVHKIRNAKFQPITLDDLQWMGQLAAMNLAVAMLSTNIAHWCHLGGALGGSAAMFLFGPRFMWGAGGIVSSPILRLPGSKGR